MERDAGDARRPRDDDDVTVDDVILSSMSKFLRELRVISGIAWPTVLYHVHSAPENHGLI